MLSQPVTPRRKGGILVSRIKPWGGVHMRRVVITGGTGLIGRRLTESLLNDGTDVVVLRNNFV